MDDLHKFTHAHCDFTLIVHHIALIALIKATLSAFPSRPVIWVMWWHQRRRNPTAQVIKHTEQHAAVLPSLTCQGVFFDFSFYYLSFSLSPESKGFLFFLLGCVWRRVETLLSSESRLSGAEEKLPPLRPGGEISSHQNTFLRFSGGWSELLTLES